jgi:hypothetical protein
MCSQYLQLAIKQALELLVPSFSLAYVVASYGYCSCCRCNTKVEKEEVTTTQEHKKPTSKRNLRNSKPGRIYHFQH